MPPKTRTLPLRGLDYHLRIDGADGGPIMLLLHGLFDTGASFQPLIGALRELGLHDYCFVAPDWRGHGDSGPARDGYWFPDYLGDLDALVAELSAHRPVALVGHSMGGQVASMYAGARPDAVSHLIALDSLNVPDAPPDATAGRYRKWLDALRTPLQPRRYATLADMVERIARRYPELAPETHLFLAETWTRETADGGFALASDPRHRWPFPYGFRLAEAMALWREVQAPTLWIEAEHGPTRDWLTAADMARRHACFRIFKHETVSDCGHMLHLQAPRAVAESMAQFLAEHAVPAPA